MPLVAESEQIAERRNSCLSLAMQGGETAAERDGPSPAHTSLQSDANEGPPLRSARQRKSKVRRLAPRCEVRSLTRRPLPNHHCLAAEVQFRAGSQTLRRSWRDKVRNRPSNPESAAGATALNPRTQGRTRTKPEPAQSRARFLHTHVSTFLSRCSCAKAAKTSSGGETARELQISRVHETYGLVPTLETKSRQTRTKEKTLQASQRALRQTSSGNIGFRRIRKALVGRS